MELSGRGLFASDDAFAVRLGRLTIDRGSRRLVARNVFRNTINGFTGLDATWTSGPRAVRAFAVLPVTRRPTDPLALAGKRVEIDRESSDALFWGVQLDAPLGADDARLEAYVVGLHERDGSVASSNRRLVTPGLRVVRAPSDGRVDFQAEAMLQLGTSRASASAGDTEDLAHRAFAGHASLGYRSAGAWATRLLLQYDHASGDRSPTDGHDDRFDPLFGARAFELNATGFYGAFARSNISSPGLRVEAAPSPRFDMMAAYRLYWLASARDTWTTSGVRDASGASGRFVGQQAEGRLRAQLVPGLATLEAGGAFLARGAFARDAPGGRSDAAVWFYTQLILTKAWP